jgi:hypothetical protein
MPQASGAYRRETMSTGGNKKSSSPSDVRYWQRAQMSNFAETHKAKRVARHKKRMAKKAS